ncbi:MAG: type II toxin-antitoxin system HicA family toxin [Bryobacteraceae bacterium]
MRGSHHIYGKVGERKTLVVPVHGNDVVKPGLATRARKRRRT